MGMTEEPGKKIPLPWITRIITNINSVMNSGGWSVGVVVGLFPRSSKYPISEKLRFYGLEVY